MHLLFFKELPYKGEGDSLKIIVVENEYKFPEPNNLSESTKKMLKMCFKKDPNDRATAEDLLKLECFS